MAIDDVLDALLAQLEAGEGEALASPVLLDWPAFWTDDRTGEEWLAAPVLPARRSVALFAPGGAGKSLLALWIAAALATGRPIFGVEHDPIDVLYLDYEMTTADLRERLEEMDYGPDVDLGHLHYALLPDLAPLDTPEGGAAVVRLAAEVNAALVVIDTFSRAVSGEENDADTVRDWYRYTGQWLKQAGRAFVRIDHAGKNVERGQRGTSAKNDDVDVVWRLTVRDDDRVELRALKRRMQWVPEHIELQREEVDNRLGYRMLNGTGPQSYPQGTAECVKVLDELAVPLDASQNKTAKAYRDAGHTAASNVLRAAIKYRKNRVETVDGTPHGTPSDALGTAHLTAHSQNTSTAHLRHSSAHPDAATSAHPAPLLEARCARAVPDDPEEALF